MLLVVSSVFTSVWTHHHSRCPGAERASSESGNPTQLIPWTPHSPIGLKSRMINLAMGWQYLQIPGLYLILPEAPCSQLGTTCGLLLPRVGSSPLESGGNRMSTCFRRGPFGSYTQRRHRFRTVASRVLLSASFAGKHIAKMRYITSQVANHNTFPVHCC